MKATSSFKGGLEKLDSHWRPGQFAKALAVVDRLLGDWPDNPVLLIKRAQLIQLQEDENGPSLDEAQKGLERAADLQDDGASAAVELGFFYFGVLDEAAGAVEWFTKAESQLVRLLQECRKGKSAALAELAQADSQTNSTPANGSLRELRGRPAH